MHQPWVLTLLACVLAISTATGAEQVFLSGATLRSPCSSSLAIDADSYTALLSSLIGQSPKKPIDIQTSAEMDQLLQPSASLQPGSLLSLHVSGVPNLDGIINSQQGHQVAVTGLDRLRSSPLASVLSQGLSAGSLDHSPLGVSFSCSNACLEQLLKEALAPLNASYTATGLPFQGTIALPSAGGSQPVEMSLKQTAAQAWATEVALLHASGMTAEAQAANRQQAGAQLKPVVLEGTLQSPKLLAVVHGSNAPETTAAVSALGAAIQQLQQQLSSVFEDRLALHMTTSNGPLKKADVRAALAMRDSQGRRRLMSSVAASGRPNRRDGLGFMAGAFAWITGLIILVFVIASCQVLGSMQFKQDSLLYGRAKTD